MIQINLKFLGLATVTSTLIAIAPISANPFHIRQVLQTRECQGCNLSRAKLSFTNLRGADLRNSNLSSADLKLADLREANLRGAILDKADLRGADLRDADLSNVYRSETNFCGAIMPDGQKFTEGCPSPSK